MILIKLEDMMWRRRIRSVSRLARLAGLSRQTVDALYNRPNRVKGFRLETLEGLCRALDCRIEDLIEYVPETDPELPHRIGGAGEEDPDSNRVDVVGAGSTPEVAQPVPPSQ
ncbi:MAG: helix-turn-helix transcriptional regulator [Gemmatimonadota bacterium]|nr:helix-turn-helix transcriptional regulator [Gemmatimonadota bacterium]